MLAVFQLSIRVIIPYLLQISIKNPFKLTVFIAEPCFKAAIYQHRPCDFSDAALATHDLAGDCRAKMILEELHFLISAAYNRLQLPRSFLCRRQAF